MPSHITIGYQLTINITPNFTVPPAIVDVHNADHVPLKRIRKQMNYYLKQNINTSLITSNPVKGYIVKESLKPPKHIKTVRLPMGLSICLSISLCRTGEKYKRQNMEVVQSQC